MVNLGFRASRRDLPASVGIGRGPSDAMSVLSIAKDPSPQMRSMGSRKDVKKKVKNNSTASSSQSVMSDVSFSMTPQLSEESTDASNAPNEFILQCKDGERIFVPSSQGLIIKSRCRYFRVALSNRSGNCKISLGTSDESDNSKDEETYEMDNSIVKTESWTPRTARHIVELLVQGSTWIENKQNRFVELLKACDEINVRICLGSLINNHDILDPASSLRFFKLKDSRFYRFRLSATIQSWQWMQLLQAGILLYFDSKVLMLSLGSTTEGASPSQVLGQHRLSKCDQLYCDFFVYSEKSRMSTFYAVFELLAANSRKDKADYSLEESFRIVCKTRVGALCEREMNMLWRMTSASYTLSTPEELTYLQSIESLKENDSQSQANRFTLPLTDFHDEDQSIAATSMTNSTASETTLGDPTGSHTSRSERSSRSSSSSSNKSLPSIPYETRTISGTSFTVLKHLFDPMNLSPKKDLSQEDHHSDPSALPACLMIENPSPDTLGRFLNACAITRSADRIGYHHHIQETSSCPNTTVYFVSTTSKRIQEIADYMADYSKTSVVGNSSDFRFYELRIP